MGMPVVVVLAYFPYAPKHDAVLDLSQPIQIQFGFQMAERSLSFGKGADPRLDVIVIPPASAEITFCLLWQRILCNRSAVWVDS